MPSSLSLTVDLIKKGHAFTAIPLLCSYSQFVIGGYYRAEGISLPTATTGGEDGEEDDDTAASEQRQTGDRDEVLAEVFTLEIVRNICQEVLQIGGLHLAEVSRAAVEELPGR